MGNFSPFFAQCSPIFPSGDLPSHNLEIVVIALSYFSFDSQPLFLPSLKAECCAFKAYLITNWRCQLI
jgi:hypothetical protein